MRRAVLLLLALALLMSAVPQLSPPKAHATYSFSTVPQAIELTPGASSYPSALQASDGTLWVAWQQYYETGVFMTYTTSRGWSVIQTLPTGSLFVISPSLQQFHNGSIILLWSSNTTGRWNLYYKLYSNGAWRSTNQLTIGSSFDDFFPTATVATNSTVYVFWERYFSSSSVSIYYKTLKGDTWSGDIQLSSSNVDVTPSALTTFDGKIWIAWSRLASGGNFNVMYRTYDGTTWSSEITLTSSHYDIEPDIVQDRNGTIWIFWSREMQLSTGTNALFQQKLWYKYSFDGSTWIPDTQLTFYGDVNTPLDDYSPSVIQGFDKALWVFYSSDYPTAAEYDIYYLKSNAISPIHNVIVSQIQSGPYAFQNNVATVAVTVTNIGDFSETIQVTVKATNSTSFTFASAIAESVPAGARATFLFAWNTTSVPLGQYTITASYPRISGQSLLSSGGNSLQYKSLTILPAIRSVPTCGFMPRNCPT